ncbi:phage tail tip lysozyme [Candidatus Saccharibacteria bacterium]|nr:phage tail tip lysozyme [Candidatus Saccharibacteria bacterium]
MSKKLGRCGIVKFTLPPLRVQLGLLFVIALSFYGIQNYAIAGSSFNDLSNQSRLIKIVDDDKERQVLTRAGSVEQLLKEENIAIDDSDYINMSRYDQLTEAYYELIIARAHPVIILDQGVVMKILTAERTIDGIIDAAGIMLYDQDTVELKTVTDVAGVGGAGLEMNITRNDTTMELSEVEAIPYQTEQQKEFTKDKDYKEVVTTGEIGQRQNTYRVYIRAGREVARELITSVVTKEPKTQIEKVGVKYSGVYTTPSENESITWSYLLAQGFSREQTAGIMGNLKQEHHFNTDGDGLAQWTGGRKANLMSRENPYNIYTQLDFLMWELNGGYLATKNRLLSSPTIEDAVLAFQNGYERCGICNTPMRMQYAYNIFESHK